MCFVGVLVWVEEAFDLGGGDGKCVTAFCGMRMGFGGRGSRGLMS